VDGRVEGKGLVTSSHSARHPGGGGVLMSEGTPVHATRVSYERGTPVHATRVSYERGTPVHATRVSYERGTPLHATQGVYRGGGVLISQVPLYTRRRAATHSL
jgi:hypothetical protein